MDTIKLFDSEIKLMDMLWEQEPVSAKQLSLLAADRIGWNKNTTYTILKKLIDKGAVDRREPGFICTSKVRKSEVQQAEVRSLIDRLYDGSRQAFFAALVQHEDLSEADLAELRDLIDKR